MSRSRDLQAACVGQIKRQATSFFNLCQTTHLITPIKSMTNQSAAQWKTWKCSLLLLKEDYQWPPTSLKIHQKLKDRGCWWRQKFNMGYLPRRTRAAEGHVSLPSVMGDRQARGAADEMQAQKEPQVWNSPLKSVLPVHDEDWRREVAEGMLKHFLRTHKSLFNGFPLARSSSGGGVYFLLPTL